MSLDTKYRPRRYADVLGQEATIKVCCEYVRQGHGFRQSYVFAGFHGGGKCVTGDTLVPTSRGLLPIERLMGPEELSTTDVAVVQEGGSIAKAAFAYRGGFRDTLRVTSHRGFQVEGTYNHQIRVLDEAGEIVWRRLDELQEGDFLCINRKGSLFGPGADLSGFSYEEQGSSDKGQFTTVPWEAPKTLSPEWGRLLGYLVGDGSCLISEYVEINNAEDDTKEDILYLLRKLAGHGIETPDKRSTIGLSKLRACRKRVRSFLAYVGLDYVGAGDKEIPWSVLQSPAEVCREFLVGYFEADGHVGPSGIEITSKSHKLLRQVQVLLLQFGIVGTLREKHVTGYGAYWRYEPDGTSRRLFADLIGFSSSRKERALDACVRQDHSAFAPENRRITNLRESIPHQHGWVARFYRSLPREHRNRATGPFFRCQRGECNLSREVLEILVSEFLSLSNDRDVQDHFTSLWDADYVFDAVKAISPRQAEVYDFNVPEGSMFAAAGLMNHNTTLGRILARALLCENPQGGEPCDVCPSCETMLADRSENFLEVDAATNSGKEHVKRITEEAQFGTFSGGRKLYLFDECFTEDTMLVTPEGPRSTRDLVEQRNDGLVASFDPATGGSCWKPVTNWYAIEDERDCVTLEFDNGVMLTVTTDQEIFTANRGWVAASELTEDDDVCTTGVQHNTGQSKVFVASSRTRVVARLVQRTSVGKRKVYDVTVEGTHSFFAYSRHGTNTHAVLAHNCHELSRQAMDAMLKPLEDNIRGTQDKQLVCIFCTTEPEKMRSAILSRCAPVFRVRSNTPEEIGARLRHICEQENIDHDPDVMSLIAEVTECHIRDAIKAVEGVSMLGRVDRQNVETYLQLDANLLFLDLLETLGFDLQAVLRITEALDQRLSPATCYQRMADVCMLAYRLTRVGQVAVPSYWDRARLQAVGERHQDSLLDFARCFAERPYHASAAMFACDVSMMHQRRAGVVVRAVMTEFAVPMASAPRSDLPSPTPPSVTAYETPSPTPPNVTPENSAASPPIEPQPKTEQPSVEKPSADPGSIRDEFQVSPMGVGFHRSARNDRRAAAYKVEPLSGPPSMTPEEFSRTLHRAVLELQEAKTSSGRSARLDDVGGP